MKLRSIILVGILLASSSQVNAQVFDLVRVVSAVTAHKTNDDFSQVGTMTIDLEGGFVTRTRLSCSSGRCTDSSKTESIFSIHENKVLLGDNKFNTKDIFLISTSPTIMLMEMSGFIWELTEYF